MACVGHDISHRDALSGASVFANAGASTSDASDAWLDSDASDLSDAIADTTLDAAAPADALTDAIDAPAGSGGASLERFHVPGTQMGDVDASAFYTSGVCAGCHSSSSMPSAPYPTWVGSLMANAGRDPLFFAQMTTANQDVPGVGYYCMRCHVPMAIVTGHAAVADGTALDTTDRDGVTCHLCHTLVDPIYVPDASPPQDFAILAGLADRPRRYGNAAFVLDPSGLRRGPYVDAAPPHAFVASPFVRSGDMCGTCHDVGNVAVARLADGGYTYNAPDARAPNPDPHAQFPLERTYAEWKLSAFANGGVDMGGRFGGTDAGVVATCQDCHMPRVSGQACVFAGTRSDLARHDFAGASAWVLDAIANVYGDAGVDVAALGVGRANAVAMLERATSIAVTQSGATLAVRMTNESGHKLPTGHIEGRRVWANVQLFDAASTLVKEYGAYDLATATLDEATTTVFEMLIGLSPEASRITGLPAGVTTHMSLADLVVKDNRIPPRGFARAAYDAVGAGAVAATYADGQHWADQSFVIVAGATRAKVTFYYQTVTRDYIEALRNGNHTDNWGTILYDAWLATGRGAPIAMASTEIPLTP